MANSSSAEDSDNGSDYSYNGKSQDQGGYSDSDGGVQHQNGNNRNGSNSVEVKKEVDSDSEERSPSNGSHGAATNHKANHSISYKEESDEEDSGDHYSKSKRVKDEDSEDDYKPEKKKSKKKKDKSSKEKSKEKSKDKSKKRKKSESDYDEPEDSDDYKPKKKSKKSKKSTKVKSEDEDEDNNVDHEDDYEDEKPAKKKKKDKTKTKEKEKKSGKDGKKTKTKEGKSKKASDEADDDASPKKKKKKEEEEEHIWKWWEEERPGEGIKWKTLEHNGPVFPPDYEPLPKSVKFYYNGKHVHLSPNAEEVASFYARMLDHDYTSMEVFNKNFFHDWKKTMTSSEKELITDLKKCNFKEIGDYFKEQTEKRKQMTKEEKAEIKKTNEKIAEKFGVCIVDGHKQKIGNFRIEPPGLFRGRGEHPKMGKLKKRVQPEDIIINIGEKAKAPAPPAGHKWKEVRHDNTVTWLASWQENIMGNVKYIMLNASSKLKSIKDWQKYEKARDLKKYVVKIREDYRADFKDREMMKRQRAVALYFIDKLALRAGNEKEEGETADTVGCCSLRVEHIKLFDEKDGKQHVVEFDFLGKDSIRYNNSVAVEKRVYKNLKHFIQGKNPTDDLFDRLNTASLNKYLNSLMDGLTAKVFRTYNASNTLQQKLNEFTKKDMNMPQKLLAYNRANREVALLCNHQRAVPKTFDKQMDNLLAKIKDKKAAIKEAKKAYKEAKSSDGPNKDKAKKKLKTLEDQLEKLEVARTDKDENKQIALGTSKLNYLDPRISVAW